jgi:hypothetical protein
MVDALRAAGYDVTAMDISDGFDFLAKEIMRPAHFHAIITNPPYDCGAEFCTQALFIMNKIPSCSFVAMLLRVDFDSAKTRRFLFSENAHWSKKIVLLDRIRWEGIKQHTASPSYNHAWYLFNKYHIGPATIAYAKKDAERAKESEAA